MNASNQEESEIDIHEEIRKFDLDFEKLQDCIYHELIELNSALSIYRRIHQLRSSYLQEMNLSPSFYQVYLHVLRNYIIISMSRLFFDTDSKSFTFIYYLKQVQRNLEFFTVSKMQIRRGLPVDYWLLREAKDLEASQLNDHRKKLNKIKAELSDIKHERDKRHAHLDRETLDASLQRVDLNQNDALDRLLGLACRAFNTISSCHSGKTFVFTPMDINDIQNTLWRVRAYLRSEQPDLIE